MLKTISATRAEPTYVLSNITVPTTIVFQPNLAKSAHEFPIETPAYATTGVANDNRSTFSVHSTMCDDQGMPGIVMMSPIIPI